MDEEQVIVELTNETLSAYLMTTESGSRYQVVIDGSGSVLMRRTPAAFTMSTMWQPSLYHDGHSLAAWIVQIKVGLPGALIFFKGERIRDDPDCVCTTRFTTVVESIEKGS